MANSYAPIARRILSAALAVAAAGLSVAALAQGPARPQSVDDVISNVLKANKDEPRPCARAAAPVIIGVRIGEHQDRTRFVVEMSDPVAMRTFTLSNPNRVIIDMPLVQWHLEAPPRPAGNGMVRSYRYGLFRSGNSRFVIDLNSPVSVSNALVVPPGGGYGYRVVVDLFPTSQTKFDAAAGWPPDLRAREEAAALLASLPPAQATAPTAGEKHVIVIDAGHGGIDSGTNGVNGLQEKDVVLDEAQRLGRILAARRDYIVHLTRESDIYIPLK